MINTQAHLIINWFMLLLKHISKRDKLMKRFKLKLIQMTKKHKLVYIKLKEIN